MDPTCPSLHGVHSMTASVMCSWCDMEYGKCAVWDVHHVLPLYTSGISYSRPPPGIWWVWNRMGHPAFGSQWSMVGSIGIDLAHVYESMSRNRYRGRLVASGHSDTVISHIMRSYLIVACSAIDCNRYSQPLVLGIISEIRDFLGQKTCYDVLEHLRCTDLLPLCDDNATSVAIAMAAKMTNASSASHVHRNLAHLVPHLSPLPLFKVEASAPSHTPSLDPQGMDSLACPPLDVLLRNVCDLTESTKIIGTKPFAHGGFSDIWRGCEWGAGATRDVAIKIVRVARKQDVGVEKLQKEDGTPLIADFGLSRLVIEFSTGLTTSSSKGSCRWMAPELFGGIDSQVLVPVTTASDVWAFGCLCIEILLGIVPWATTRNDAAIILAVVQHRKTPPLPESTSSVPVGHIMSHCWAYEPSHRPSMVQLVNALRDVDPEWLHTSVCTLLLPMPTVLSDSPPPIRNSDSDSFTRTFGESPLISGSQTETRTKTPIALIPLDPLFSPREPPPSHQRVTPVSSTGATPYLDMLSFTPSDSGSSGPASRDEPPLFEISQPPLFGPGPRRPSRGIREVRQNSQPIWPRTPSSSSSTLPHPVRGGGGGGDDAFRSEAWRTRDTTPASTRPPSQSSLHIWTPTRPESRHGSHIPSMSPISQTSSDRSATTTSLPTPVTPVPPHTHYRYHHSASYGPPVHSPDYRYQGSYFAGPPLELHPPLTPNGSIPRDFQFARSNPIRISAPDGTPVILPERKSSSSSPTKSNRAR
ncbi:protein tyrosine kinase domain-containing protein [Rhizoctonia solani AG-1 IA]|uniref:Protein tyrosine kinase domain-containing protein n=1 Tax=Thanatephorus cucumeris (strain AG1-IA) TaxID=983506 RepID=L8WW09_THACA|nr:protein tyrosine kinase domain-containing protein [Rhizoctonia solani AG-1 IA]